MSPPLFVVFNQRSGADADDTLTIIEATLRGAGHSVTSFEIPEKSDPKKSCEPIVTRAAQEKGVVIVAGGDGTVNAIATLCYRHHVPFGIVPLGTFNYLARALDIPTELKAALDVISSGRLRAISAGFVQEHLFLNNASFGLYPTLIRKREEATRRFGRKRLVAAFSALHSLLSRQKIFSIHMHTQDHTQRHVTNMVFVGNNSLQLENLGLEVSECARNDQLAVVVLKPLNRFQTCGLIWRGIIKNLKFESRLIQFCANEFEVETRTHRIDMVVDGEIVQCQTPLAFRVEAQALRVLVPAKTTEEA